MNSDHDHTGDPWPPVDTPDPPSAVRRPAARVALVSRPPPRPESTAQSTALVSSCEAKVAGARQSSAGPHELSVPPARASLHETVVRPSGSPRGAAFEATELQTGMPSPESAFGALPGVPRRYEFLPEDGERWRELGRGGLGRVLVAVDRQLGREVAVKELLPEVAASSRGREVLARFVREAKITGQLEHPNIVPVYEIGSRPDGTAYYTMRLVRGRTLADALAEATDLPSRLGLLHHFAGLCQAIAFAHSRGVIHRDIKPQNVMIGEFGETVVLDWGIAKVRGTEDGAPDARPPGLRLSDGSELHRTRDGNVMGTPAYMSPEQAAGDIDRVDEQSDVWALGTVLYRLLTGRLPFEADALPELLERIRSRDFERVRTVDPAIPSDLAAIAERALRCDSSARYRDAGELLRDVLAFQSGARVGAYEYSSVELFRRFVAKNKNALVVLAGAACALIVFGALAYWRVLTARDRALDAERKAQKSAESAEASLAEAFADKARMAVLDGDLWAAEIFAAKALGLQERPDARGIVVSLSNRAVPSWSGVRASGRTCTRAAYSRSRDAWGCVEGRKIWAIPAGASSPRHHEASAEVTSLTMVEESGAVVWGEAQGKVGVWLEPPHAQPRVWAADGRAITFARASVDGRIAVTAAGSNVRVWEVEGERLLAEHSFGETVSAARLTRDARRIAIGGRYGTQRIWHWETDRSVELERHAGTVLSIALSADERTIATGSSDRTLRFYALTTGVALGAAIQTQSAVTAIAWSPDGRYLASGGKDDGLRLHDPRREGSSVHLSGFKGAVEEVQFSEDGRQVLARDGTGTVMVWDLGVPKPWSLQHRGNVLGLAYSPLGGSLISAGIGRQGACLWDLAAAQCETRLPVPVDRIRSVAVSPDGQRIALAGLGGKVFLWDSAKRIPTHVLDAHRGEVRSVSFSPDGRRLVSGGVDRAIRIWNARSGQLERTFRSHAGIQSALFMGSGEVATGNRAGAIEFWSLVSGRRSRVVLAHSDWVMGLARRGAVLAAAGAEGTISVWDATEARLVALLRGHEGRVTAVDLSEDGEWVASASEDRTVRLWQWRAGKERARLLGHQAGVRAVRFAPDSLTVASGSDDGSVRLWALDSLERSGASLLRAAQRRSHRTLNGTQLEMATPR